MIFIPRTEMQRPVKCLTGSTETALVMLLRLSLKFFYLILKVLNYIISEIIHTIKYAIYVIHKYSMFIYISAYMF